VTLGTMRETSAGDTASGHQRQIDGKHLRSSDLLPQDRHVRWAWFSVAATVLLALVPLLFNHRFYFADDTQAGAYGIWYSLGEHLRAGEWPLFEPSRWMSGNYAAEGQWGLWNPVILLLGFVTPVVPNAVVLCTGVKVFALGIASGGIFVLSRSYGARPDWASAAAVTVPLAGTTVYLDAASWVTGVFVWGLLPWVWWGLRRTAFRRGNVLVPFGFGYLLVTVGYVHGTILLVAVVLGVLVEAAIDRAWHGFVRVLLTGALLGLVALTVYLPGVLTAGVTNRSDAGVTNHEFMSPDLSGLMASSISTAHPWLNGFWALPLAAPLVYLTWLLPALAFIDWRRAARLLPAMAGLLTVGVVSLALAFGPDQIGPLRFPIRLMPYVALTALVLLMVLLSRAAVRPGPGRTVGALALLLAGWYSALAADPTAWVPIGVAMLLALGGVLAVGAVLRHHRDTAVSVALVSVVFAFTAGSALLQHDEAPASPLPDFHLPAPVSAYQNQLRGVSGDTVVISLPTSYMGPAPWAETLLSNAWYLNDASVQNVYTALAYRTYATDLCMQVHGDMCPDALPKLFERDAATGRALIDLLSVNNVQINNPLSTSPPSTVHPPDASLGGVPPVGWHVSQRAAHSEVWTRDIPVASAGGVVWASPGTRVTVLDEDKRNVRLRIDATGPNGGKVTFSRLAWPGYSINGATKADPMRDYLLTVDVAADSAGNELSVSFSPPGWHAEIAAIIAAVLIALGWGGTEGVRALDRRRRTRAASTPLRENATPDD
jgi:hypothetical protein